MLRAVIVDDERPSCDKLAKLLLNSGRVELAGIFTKPLEAIAFLKSNVVDVIFLDIEMPEMSGIELSNHMIEIQENAAIVFVTAYNKYAVEAFQLNALDYIMKPISACRLDEALKKIIDAKGLVVHTEGVNISCFGRFTVRKGAEEVKFRTEKAEELLAFMMDKQSGFVSRSEIIDSLWADFDGERALIHFNTTLHYLKKALLQCGVNMPFRYDRGGYKFDIRELNCDYLKFCAFLVRNKAPSPGNILEYEETAELVKGEYLSGWDYEWIALKRLFLEECFLQMLLDMARFFSNNNEHRKAAQWLKTGLAMEPLHRK